MAETSLEALGPLTDQLWRLNNLYQIRDKDGRAVSFRMNAAQLDLFNRQHYRNVILKARQLGCTTFIQIYCLDQCLFFANTAAGTIAHTLNDAADIFENKAKFAYDNLPPGLKDMCPAHQDSARKLSFDNGSSLTVGTSLRSGTYQLLHVSEMGKIAANTPEKSKEIRTGAFNTVPTEGMIWVESTAEGSEGDFYDMCKRAQDLAALNRDLTPLNFKFLFYNWTWEPNYSLDADVPIPADLRKYFAEMEASGLTFSDGQKTWYTLTAETQHEEMRREYPTTPEEAFEASIEGAYYASQMAKARAEQRICKVPIEDLPVSTFWDLGIDDETTIWLHQRLGLEDRFIGYLHGSGEGAAYYGQWLEEWRREHSKARPRALTFGKHYLPHDGDMRSLATKTTYRATLGDSGLSGQIAVIPRTKDLQQDIQAVRNVLARCWFDEERCEAGIRALDNYRREWDANRATFKSTPLHDWASHGADAFRQFAVGYRPVVGSSTKPAKRARV